MAGRRRTKRDLGERAAYRRQAEKSQESPPNRKPSTEQNKVKTTLGNLAEEMPELYKTVDRK